MIILLNIFNKKIIIENGNLMYVVLEKPPTR